MAQKLLSIVVPTKNRYAYLFELIKLLATFHSDEFEMVIQDNSNDNGEFFKTINLEDYPFISYFYRKEPVSQATNSDLSILNSCGEYICFIGDDDGVTRYIIDAVKWMKKNNFTILKSALAIFKWPSFISPKGYDVSGSVLFNDFSCTYKIINNNDVLEDLLKNGMETLENMPKVYNGIVKRAVLDKIYHKCGTFFPGPSPDMANAVALAIEEQSYVFVDYPIIIGGHSVNLGSNAARYKGGIGPLDEQPFIDQKYKDGWSFQIPKVWSSRTVWPESAITALKAYNANNLLKKVDYEIILRKFAVSHPSFIPMAMRLSKNKLKLLAGTFLRIAIKPFFYFKIKKCYLDENKFGGLTYYKYYKDIVEAEERFLKKLSPFSKIEYASKKLRG